MILTGFDHLLKETSKLYDERFLFMRDQMEDMLRFDIQLMGDVCPVKDSLSQYFQAVKKMNLVLAKHRCLTFENLQRR